MSLQAKKSEGLFPSLVSFVLVHQWQTQGLEALTRNKIKVWHRVTCWVWPWADFQEHALCGSAPAPRCQPSLFLRCVSALLRGELQSFSEDGLAAQKGGKLKGAVRQSHSQVPSQWGYHVALQMAFLTKLLCPPWPLLCTKTLTFAQHVILHCLYWHDPIWQLLTTRSCAALVTRFVWSEVCSHYKMYAGVWRLSVK